MLQQIQHINIFLRRFYYEKDRLQRNQIRKKGTIFEYSFGEVKLLVYRTNDFIDDEAILLVKNNKTVVVESPCFNDNIAELEQFIKDTGTQVEGVVLAYHMGGGTFLPNVKKYTTKKANTYGTVGGGKALVENFTKAFGNIFDSSIHSVTNIIAGETLKKSQIPNLAL